MAQHYPTVYITAILVLLVLITVHDDQPHLAVASTDSHVLVASVSSSNDQSSFYLDLPLGTPPQKLPLTLDVQSPFTTLRCSNRNSSSSSFHPSLSSTFLNTPYPPPTCARKPTSRRRYGPLSRRCSCADDTVNLFIQRTNFPDPLLSVNVSAVNFTCCAHSSSSTAASGAAGIAGFSKGNESLPAQISKSAGLASQFSYCLPNIAFFGRVTTYAILVPQIGQMETFTTSLQTKLYYVSGGGYAFRLHNISMSGGGTAVMRKPMMMRISTTQKYTTLTRSVYKAFRESFRQALGYGTVVKAVQAIAPFDTCFDTTTIPIPAGQEGPYLKSPTMGFEVEGGGGWILYPRSIFAYNGTDSSVACMAILQADIGQPSVLGTFQQLDCLAEFDLEHSLFGFSSIFTPYVNHPEAPFCFNLLYPLFPS